MTKKEISENLWRMMRRIYEIGSEVPTSDKQIQLINELTEYVDQHFVHRKKPKEKACQTSNQS